MKPTRRFMVMIMDLRIFDFMVQHRLGRQNVVADVLSCVSCAAVTPVATFTQIQKEDSECCALRQSLPVSGGADNEYFVLIDVLYPRLFSDFSVIVVPTKMRQNVLELCQHSRGNMVIIPSLTKSERLYWWPHMSSTISNYVESCHTCQLNNGPTKIGLGSWAPCKPPSSHLG